MTVQIELVDRRRNQRGPTDAQRQRFVAAADDRLALDAGQRVEAAALVAAKPQHVTGAHLEQRRLEKRALNHRHDLFVAPPFRRAGVGQILMDHAAAFCRQRGAGGMYLLTEVTNTTAQALYESKGWSRDTQFYRDTQLLL